MKRITFSFIAFTVSLVMYASTSSAAGTCSTKSLKGTYLFDYGGANRLTGKLKVYATVGMSVFDGKGHVEMTYSDSLGANETVSGNYQVSSDCSGRIDYPEWNSADKIFVSADGTQAFFIDTRVGLIENGSIYRVAKSAPRNCSEKTLRGTYGYSVRGITDPSSIGASLFGEAGMESLDGAGNIVNRYTDSNGVSATVTGQYALAANCMGTATYGADSYQLYADPHGKSFVFLTMDRTNGGKFGQDDKISSRLLLKPLP